MKRVWALILAVILVLGTVPFAVLPVGAKIIGEVESGSWGKIFWVGKIPGLKTNTISCGFKISANWEVDYALNYINDNDIPPNALTLTGITYTELSKADDLYDEKETTINIVLEHDWETEHFITANTNINIDLNGYTWTITGDDTMDSKDKNLTVCGGTMVFKNSDEGPISTTEHGNLTIRDVVFRDCHCDGPGLVYFTSYSGQLYMENVTFNNCYCDDDGSCVYLDNPDFGMREGERPKAIFKNCDFINCHSNDNGGVIYSELDNCDITFENCRFLFDYAGESGEEEDGGVIYADGDYDVWNFLNCIAYNCYASGDGGFLFVRADTATFNGAPDSASGRMDSRSTVCGCYALSDGGAVYTSNESGCGNHCTISGFNFVQNTAGGPKHSWEDIKKIDKNSWGGALCMRGDYALVTYCDFYDNYGTRYGGAVYLGQNDSTIEHCTFSENISNKGNALYVDDDDNMTVNYCTFYTSSYISGDSVAGDDIDNYFGNHTLLGKNGNSVFLTGDPDDGDYMIYTAISPSYRCIDIDCDNGGKSNGDNLHLFYSPDAWANIFTLTKQDDGGYIIKSKYSGLVLDVAGGSKANGTNIQQYQDNGNVNQRWYFEPTGDGLYYIRSGVGTYMDVEGGKTDNDTNICAWAFNGGENQQFMLVRVMEEGDYVIRSALDEKYGLDIYGGTTAVGVSGANLHLWDNGAARVFTVAKGSKGELLYTIKAKVTGLMVDMSGGGITNGTNIQQWPANDSYAQLWRFVSAGDGYYYIQNGNANYYDAFMDVQGMTDGAKPYNGVNVYGWRLSGDLNQMFKLCKASGAEQKPNAMNGDGTKENPYKIRTSEQWNAFATNVRLGETYEGKYIELTDDIPVAYVPVGYYNQRKAFKGHFNGNNHTVNYIDSSEYWDRGLFSYCVNAEIKNVRVTGRVRGTVTLAGICASAENTTFENCVNDAIITSINDKYVAGICAIANNCKFTDCTNNGEIHSADKTAGGIVALSEGDKTQIIECRNNGYVYAKSYDVGGIVADAAGDIVIKNCINNAKVEATDSNSSAAGILGCAWKGADITNCINTEKGTISTVEFAAGMLGWAENSGKKIHIANCANYGEIKVTKGTCGGIVVNFNNSNMTVENCFNGTDKIPSLMTATGAKIDDGDYIICSAVVNGGVRCLDINCNKGGKNNGDNLQIYTTSTAWANVFTITEDEDGKYIIRSKNSGLVLDIEGNSSSSGANIYQYQDYGNNNQRWYFEPTGDGYFYIRSGLGTYMDVEGGKTDDGTNVCSWSFNGGNNQKFWLQRIMEDGDYIFRSAVDENYAIDIDGGAKGKEGASIFMWNNGEAKVFTVTKNGKIGKHTVKSKVTGLVWDINGSNLQNGTNIFQWTNYNTNNQLWYFEPTGDGYYYIRSGLGTYMDVSAQNGMQPYNGINVQSWSFTGGKNQKFKIVDSSGNPLSAHLSTGTIASPNSKGNFINCYSVSGGPGDKRATALSGDDKYLQAVKKLNVYICEHPSETKEWAYWWLSPETEVAEFDFLTTEIGKYSGSGTKNDPFIIEKASELRYLEFELAQGKSKNVNGKYFLLKKDIAYSGSAIGDKDVPFSGIFDGGGHTVTVTLKGVNRTGLFGVIKNATIRNLNVTGTVDGQNGWYVGGIAGEGYNSTVENCSNSATVTGLNYVAGIVGAPENLTFTDCVNNGVIYCADSNAAGIAGGAWKNNTFIGCCNNAPITAKYVAAGGILGGVWDGCVIINCVNTQNGTIEAESKCGGIVGNLLDNSSYSPRIENCANLGKVTGTQYVAGIVRNNNPKTTVKNCFSGGKINATKGCNYAAIVQGVQVGHFHCYYMKGIGHDDAGSTAVETKQGGVWLVGTINKYLEENPELKKEWTLWGLDMASHLASPLGTEKDVSTLSGLGSETEPYIIKSASDFVEISTRLNDELDSKETHYRLIADISDYVGTPIGTKDCPFVGVFDGNGYTVSIKSMNSGENVGLFGYVDGGTITNLYVKGEVNGSLGNTGAVVGTAKDAKIINCASTATVKGASQAGGIVGYAFGTTLISNCYASSIVNGSGEDVGGIAGKISDSTVVRNSIKIETVTGSESVGGIVGLMDGANCAVQNCGHYGNITGTGLSDDDGESSALGGVVGKAENGGEILLCLFVGRIDVDSKNGAKFVDNSYGIMVGEKATGTSCDKLYYCQDYVNKSWNAVGNDGNVKATGSSETKCKKTLMNTINKLVTSYDGFSTWYLNKTDLGSLSCPENYVAVKPKGVTDAASVFAKNAPLVIGLCSAVVVAGAALALAVGIKRRKKKQN